MKGSACPAEEFPDREVLVASLLKMLKTEKWFLDMSSLGLFQNL